MHIFCRADPIIRSGIWITTLWKINWFLSAVGHQIWRETEAIFTNSSRTKFGQSSWTVQMYRNVYGMIRGWGQQQGCLPPPHPQPLPCLTRYCTTENILRILFANYWWILPQMRYSPIVREQSLWNIQMYSNVYGRVRGRRQEGCLSPPQPLPYLTRYCTTENILRTLFANYCWISPHMRYSPIVREQSLWNVQMYSNVYGRVRERRQEGCPAHLPPPPTLALPHAVLYTVAKRIGNFRHR